MGGTEQMTEPMNVLINVVGEDPIEEFWHPRLKVAGSDMARVRVSEHHWLLPGSLGSMRDELERLNESGFHVDVLTLESLSTHLKNPLFGFRDNRTAMEGLVTIAETFDMTILFACHFRKGRASTVESAIAGQGILQNSAKAIYVLSNFPDAASSTRVLACERINGPEPTSLMFELETKYVREAGAPHPFLRYVGPIDVTAREVYNASRLEGRGSGITGVDHAAQFIREYMEQHQQVAKISELEEAARAADRYYSKGTFERARKAAGLRVASDDKVRELLGPEYPFRAGEADGRTRWVMLPSRAVGENSSPSTDVGRTRLSVVKDDR
jgi:hypothetical protein